MLYFGTVFTSYWVKIYCKVTKDDRLLYNHWDFYACKLVGIIKAEVEIRILF